ncbi:NADH-quinone oxidoreductase subunit C [Candidatus Amarolinea dominans]|uniref:NADH-quinone oxidoreductase subunit C n=1 Tax=Candidatus Amarolinea dominans TaxID=3140696 RepID=UPI0031CC5745
MAEARTIDSADLTNAVPGAVTATLPNGDLVVAREKLIEFSTYLRDKAGYDYLSNVTGVDYLGYKGRTEADRFEVVYHVFSTRQGGGPVTMHVRAPASDPSVPSVISVWPGTDLQEREIWDLYGIRFPGHPNLRRILLWEGFDGHPMRKDWKEAYFEDDKKPFKSRHPDGHHTWAETRTPWAHNVAYASDFDPQEWLQPATQFRTGDQRRGWTKWSRRRHEDRAHCGQHGAAASEHSWRLSHARGPGRRNHHRAGAGDGLPAPQS